MSHNAGRGYGPASAVGQRRNQGNVSQGQRQQGQQGQGRGRVGGPPAWNHQNQQQAQAQPNLRQQAQSFLQVQESQQKPQPQAQQQKPTPVPPPKEEPVPKPTVVESPEGIETKMVIETKNVEFSNGTSDTSADQEIEEEGEKQTKTKPFWVKGPGKVNKKELRRRRNIRLRKILQPKNALMVLNELVGSTPYDVCDLPDPFNGTSFQCSIQVEGVQHQGQGKSKPAAKNAAAEAALKHMVLTKMKNLPSANSTLLKPEAAEEMKMDIDDAASGISWSHVACYALHKLLNSWDEGTGMNFPERVGLSGDSIDSVKNIEKKPAKKVPELAHTMNPVMLLNQMFPNAAFEEVSREGNPPNIQFTVKCNVGNDTFFGSGTTKKTAKRMCAFAACRQVLGIQYPPAFLEEQGFSEDVVQVVAGNQ